jgi:hypothetical protein
VEYLILIVVAILTYYKTIFYQLTVDDLTRYHAGRDLTDRKFKFRFIYTALKTSGQILFPVKVDHAINLVIHTTVSLLIYFVFGQTHLSFLSALLFLLHPTNHQVSIWLNGKRYAISTALVLLIWYFKPLGLGLYWFIPAWQINGILAPLLFLFTKWYWLALTVGLGAFIGKKRFIRWFKARARELPKNSEHMRITPKKIILYIKTFRAYLFQCVYPLKNAFWHEHLWAFGYSKEDIEAGYKIDKDFWFSLGVFTGYIGVMIFNLNNIVGFGMFWFLLFISQWCHLLVHCLQSFADRYCYLAMIGLMIAIPHVLPEWAVFLLVGTYLAKLQFIMPMYENFLETLRYSNFIFPKQGDIISQDIAVQLEAKNFITAWSKCMHALHDRPKDFVLNCQMAQAAMGLKQWSRAEHYLKMAENNPVLGKEAETVKNIKILRDYMERKKNGQ